MARLHAADGAIPTRLSIVVPVLNEEALLAATLSSLAPLRSAGHEVVVVDGGSTDASLAIADPLADRVLTSPPGRALQMNAGATAAQGDVLLFLHADSTLPDHAALLIAQAITAGARWGRFDVRIDGQPQVLKLVAWMMNARSRATGIATGDQGMFVERGLFVQAGRFPPIPLMEDIALSRQLKRIGGRPACLRARIVTSGRRWETRGPWRTVFTMWRLRLAYALGADPARLAREYR